MPLRVSGRLMRKCTIRANHRATEVPKKSINAALDTYDRIVRPFSSTLCVDIGAHLLRHYAF
jgi:hypothetical protein